MSCVFCDATEALDRRSGLDVCHRCALGDIDVGLARWGLHATHRAWTRRHEGTVEYNLSVIIDLPSPIDAHAHFRRETGLDRMVQWVRRSEPQAGDALFDRSVFVANPAGSLLDPILADPHIQGAILDLVADGGVFVERSQIRAMRMLGEPPDLPATRLQLALLGVHLVGLAATR